MLGMFKVSLLQENLNWICHPLKASWCVLMDWFAELNCVAREVHRPMLPWKTLQGKEDISYEDLTVLVARKVGGNHCAGEKREGEGKERRSYHLILLFDSHGAREQSRGKEEGVRPDSLT